MVSTSLSPNPVLEALEFRHATKLFDADRQIDNEEFEKILAAARLSPTSFGLEPFEIHLIQDAELREHFRATAWGASGAHAGTRGQLGTASHFGVITAYNSQRAGYDSDYLDNFLREVKGFDAEGRAGYLGVVKNFQLNEFDLTTERALVDWSAKQAYIALANMMTTAASLGIDSCPMEGFDQATVKQILKDRIGVDMSYQEPAVLFAFGYRAADPAKPRTRRSLERLVSWH